MPAYFITGMYSAGSWARMIRIADDRVEAADKLMQSLGGSLTCAYWDVSGRAVRAIADLPDSSAAAAVVAVLTHTGAFKDVEICEVLNQDQFTCVLKLADNVAPEYRVPGQALLQDDSSLSRFQW